LFSITGCASPAGVAACVSASCAVSPVWISRRPSAVASASPVDSASSSAAARGSASWQALDCGRLRVEVVAGERGGIGGRQGECGARQCEREHRASDERDGRAAKACRHRGFLSGWESARVGRRAAVCGAAPHA
jgi:hypothetical protein